MTVETRLALGGVFLVVCLASLDHNIVATALPQVVADLGGVEHLGWVVTAFLLPSTVAMPLYGKMSDLYGQRNVLTFAVATFLVGSALCGLAQSMLQLILFRALQGVGAGGLFTLALTVIASTVAPAERARYQALVVGAGRWPGG
jgi:MFS family permease